jgi:hypothetical protein
MFCKRCSPEDDGARNAFLVSAITLAGHKNFSPSGDRTHAHAAHLLHPAQQLRSLSLPFLYRISTDCRVGETMTGVPAGWFRFL